MKKVELSCSIVLIDLEDYEKSGHGHMPCNSPARVALFDFLTEPNLVSAVITCVKTAGNSPIRYYDPFLYKAIATGKLPVLSKSDRQFAGAVICVLMEANGFSKTGEKDRITKKERVFTQAEIYSV